MYGIAEDITQVKDTSEQLERALRESKNLRKKLRAAGLAPDRATAPTVSTDGIIGSSPGIVAALNRVDKVAGTDANVLILGETGTGKELFAQAIHRRSQRSQEPFVRVNCDSLPESLMESELFGHVQGAFTGATTDRLGRFELADRGTIFLDEIGELSSEMQSKLLRVLQEGDFEIIGASETVSVDVRVVAATNRDLYSEVIEGRFRADLYYRLAVFPIVIPPLRQRRNDIPALVWDLISVRHRGTSDVVHPVPEQAMQRLLQHDWPGNVRELQNVGERALIMSEDGPLTVDNAFDVPMSTYESETTERPIMFPSQPDPPDTCATSLEDVARAHITRVLEAYNWTIKGPNGAAERLELSPSTLRYRMKKLGILRPVSRKPR